MIIKKKRIRNVSRYLWEFNPGDIFYVATPLTEAELSALRNKYGLQDDFQGRIPIPRGTYSARNANGRWNILKDRPKEPRVFEHSYHVIDWNGDHHYGICHQTRMCYQRKLIPPQELSFSIEDKVLYSPKLVNTISDYERIQLAINLMLEMVGHCEIWSSEKVPVTPPETVKVLPWEILRAGTRDKCELNTYIEKTVERKSTLQAAAIRNRHEYLQAQQPDFFAIGTQNFFGYVVYGFSNLRLYVFECNQPNNATYLFTGDWQSASKLTKTEILAGHVQDARIFHTERWHENIRNSIGRYRKEAS